MAQGSEVISWTYNEAVILPELAIADEASETYGFVVCRKPALACSELNQATLIRRCKRLVDMSSLPRCAGGTAPPKPVKHSAVHG